MRLRAGVATNTGRVRDLNEDAYGLRPEQGLFVVCDGMGGAPAGEVASQIAVDTILAQLNTAAQRAAGSAETGEHRYLPQTSHLVGAVRRSNQFIYDRAQHDRRQADMGTTVVGVWIEHNIASIAHVGDSRAYLWHDDQLEPLTRDHSLVEAQVGAGLLKREQSLQSEQQNISVVHAELAQSPFQAPAHQFGDTRIGLNHQNEVVALRGQIANRVAESTAPKGAPVEVIDAVLEGLLDGRRRHAIAGGYSETAHAQACASERRSLKGFTCFCRLHVLRGQHSSIEAPGVR